MNMQTGQYQSVRRCIRSLSRALRTTLTAMALLLLLNACGGGIFGTGDGSDIIDSTGGDNGDQEEINTIPDENDSDGSGTDEIPDNGETVLEERAFENLDTGSDQNTPLLTLVNLSQLSINAHSDTDTQTLFETDIQAGEVSPRVVVPLSAQALSVTATASNSLQLRLSPLNLGASSVTTLIARDRLAESAASAPKIEILAMPSQGSVSSDALVRVRIVQAYALAGDTRPAQMTLLPAGEQPGSSEATFGQVSPTRFQQIPDYQQVSAGSYELQDSLQRFAPVPLILESGQSYTLILTGSEAVLTIVQDSE